LTSVLKPSTDKKIIAGETTNLELTVENKGTEPASRVRGWIESDNGFLDRREFLFGQLKPGEKRSWSVSVKTPKDLASRRDGVVVKLQDDSGLLQETTVGELNFVELPRPQFAYTWSLIDSCDGCNNVTNVGTGKALDTFTSIRNASDANIFISKGRFKLGELEPGETKTARFQVEVKKGYKGDDFGLRLAILDEPLEEFTADKLMVPIVADGAAPIVLEPRRGSVVRVADKAEVFASADAKRALAKLPKGAVLTELARGSTVSKVEFGENRTAFIRVGDVRDARGQKPVFPKDAEWIPFHAPAQISMNVDPSQGGAVIDGEKFTLSSVVNDPNLLDVFVLVNDQKVFFKGKEPGESDKLKFSTEFSLKEGNNLVTVIARESQDFATRKTVVVRRRPAAVAQKMPVEPKQ
jgi:carboxyl-terminal processing protease